jgi:hypothetical protein
MQDLYHNAFLPCALVHDLRQSACLHAFKPESGPSMSQVTYLSSWSDPGAKAFDVNAYGVTVDVTGSISSTGAGRVDTSQPTDPKQPYGFAIIYTVCSKGLAQGSLLHPVQTSHAVTITGAESRHQASYETRYSMTPA